jgi:membrane protein DedA with SNARE-associated domain
LRRIALLAAAIAGVFLASFVICQHYGVLTDEWTRAKLAEMPAGWALAAVAGFLAADLVLPVPSSVVLAAGGQVAGWKLAALAGTTGMLAGNLAGYWLCRLLGQRAFGRLVRPGEAEHFGRWLSRWGPAALVISRLVPMMAETLSCLAGAGRMAFGRFLAALVVGTIPVAVFFAAWGERGPYALWVSLAVPAAGWLAFAIFSRKTAAE